MSYELAFLSDALKEWNKLDAPVKTPFKKKLKERLVEPLLDFSKTFPSKNDNYS